MVPVMTILIGLPQVVAQGTALAAMVLPSVLSSLTYFSRGCVKTGVLPGLLGGITIGSLVGGNGQRREICLPLQGIMLISVNIHCFHPQETARCSCPTIFSAFSAGSCLSSPVRTENLPPKIIIARPIREIPSRKRPF